MPVYSIECKVCGYSDTIWRKIPDRDTLPECSACCGPMARRIVAPAIQTDITPYISPATGRVISSKSAQADELKRTGHIINEPGLDKDIARNKIEREHADFAPIASAIDNTVSQLVSTGKLQS